MGASARPALRGHHSCTLAPRVPPGSGLPARGSQEEEAALVHQLPGCASPAEEDGTRVPAPGLARAGEGACMRLPGPAGPCDWVHGDVKMLDRKSVV